MADKGIEPVLDPATQECVARCRLHGLATGAITFTGFYLGQRSVPSGLARGPILASSAFFAVVGSYLVTSHCASDCVKTARMRREAEERRAGRAA